MAYCLLKFCFIFIFFHSYSNAQGIPKKYLNPDEKPTEGDLDLYLDRLNRLVDQQSNYNNRLNRTDGNALLGLIVMTSFLKRTLQDYKYKLGDIRIELINKILADADYYASHMIWEIREENHAIATLTYATGILASTMKSFNTKLLPKLLLESEPMSEFSSSYDDLSLSKEIYANLTYQDTNKNYAITSDDSDKCMLSSNWNTIPGTPEIPLRPCKSASICSELIFKKLSVAYTLSHRLINQLIYLMGYRCYFHSETQDFQNFHELCAEMYRESIYLARRGFFARDIFMEHVAACAFGGYEEFHRRRWFLKAASFVDDFGCVQEFRNFTMNRTAVLIRRTDSIRKIREHKQKLAYRIATQCQPHEMAVATAMLGAAVRHAAHHML